MLRQSLILLLLSTVVSSQCNGGIPSSEVDGFLSVHNKLRSSISAGTYVAKGKTMPAAKTPIANLTWDCTIEKSAQAVADTCVFEHSKRETYGENLYSYWDSEKSTFTGTGASASQSWESEFQAYGWGDLVLTEELFDSVGHATQMAWAKTTSIGCGMKLCDEEHEVLVVCQYNPAGNIVDQLIYE